MSNHGHFLPTKATKIGERARFVGLFQGCTGFWDGRMLARVPISPAQGLHYHGPRYFNFLYCCTMCGLEKLGLVDQNCLERNLSALLLRTLAVDRQQQSESIEATLDMELGGLINRFDIGRCHCL